MTATYSSCALNGVPLGDVSDDIWVTDIEQLAPGEQETLMPWTVRAGARLVRKKRDSLAVVVRFVIAQRSPPRRNDICQRVQEWAKAGGYLTTNDRPGQRLRVICDVMPRLSSALKWQEKLSVRFAAYEWPYWEDETPAKTTVTGAGTLFVPGVGETLCSVSVTNTGRETVSALEVYTGETRMAFEGIALPAGGTLEVGYTGSMNLYASIGGASVLAKRTESSADDLRISCGAMEPVGVSGGTLQAVFFARGVYE